MGKTGFLRLLRLLPLLALIAADVPPRLRRGDRLPALTLPRLGQPGAPPLRIADLHEQVLVISLFASYCEVCRQEIPVLRHIVDDLNREEPRRPYIRVVAIGVDERAEDAARFATEVGLTGDVLFDAEGQARQALDPRKFPCSFLVDRSHVVRHIYRGFGPGYESRMQSWLRELRSPAG